jgi:hypothetical protein
MTTLLDDKTIPYFHFFYLTKLARDREATYHAPHANIVTMAPSPLVRKIMSKHDEDMGRIGKKYLRTAGVSAR